MEKKVAFIGMFGGASARDLIFEVCQK